VRGSEPSQTARADLSELERLIRLLRRVRRAKRSRLAQGFRISRQTAKGSRPRWSKLEEATAPFDLAAARAFRALRRRRKAGR